MATGIIALLGTLAALIFWLVKRSAGKADDPVAQHDKRYEETDREIIKRDAEAANRSLDDDLRRVHDLEIQGHLPGKGGDPAPKGPDVQPGG